MSDTIKKWHEMQEEKEIKYITDELIEKGMIELGYGEISSHCEETVRSKVLDHYGVKFTDNMMQADFSVYEETTADGYSVWIATHDINSINIGEDVHYYDGDLGDKLADFIEYSNGDVDFPELIHVDDEYDDWVVDVINDMYLHLAELNEQDVIDDLIDKGYIEKT